MDARSRILAGTVGFIALVAILSLVGWRWGIVQFNAGVPSISLARLLNHRPSLDRPVNFPADFSDEARQTWRLNVATSRAAIEKNPADVSSWFDLAIYYKMVGDYDGALEIWEYVDTTYPTGKAVALHNLGEYYFHTLKDYPTAEQYYRQSIAIAPQFAINYSDLFDIYRYVYKQDTRAAADIIKEGLAHVPAPDGIVLELSLADYYKSKSDTANARAMLRQAREGAKAIGDSKVLYQIDQQLKTLEK